MICCLLVHCVQKTPKSQALSVQLKLLYILNGNGMGILRYQIRIDSVEGKIVNFREILDRVSPCPSTWHEAKK